VKSVHFSSGILGLLIFLISSSILSAGPAKSVIDAQIENSNERSSGLKRKVVPLQQKLKGMTQFNFKTPSEMEAYEAEKTAIRKKIDDLGSMILAEASSCTLLMSKKKLFSESKEGKYWTYFASSSFDFKAFENESEQLISLHQKFFSKTDEPRLKAQVFIYSSKEEFERYEAGSDNAKNYLRQDFCKEGAISSVKYSVKEQLEMVSLGTQDLDGFRHLISHLILDRFMNPASLSLKRHDTYPFFREGIGEYVATLNDNERYWKIVEAARANQDGEPIAEGDKTGNLPVYLLLEKVPDLSDSKMPFFYSEAALLIRWLESIPEGYALLRQFLKCRPDEREILVRNHQAMRKVSQNGFREYYMWRTSELRKIEEKKKATTE
jgi:hypothetical protein